MSRNYWMGQVPDANGKWFGDSRPEPKKPLTPLQTIERALLVADGHFGGTAEERLARVRDLLERAAVRADVKKEGEGR